MRAARIKLVWGTYWAVLFALMHIPKDRLPHLDVSLFDKEVHFIGYGLLAALCAWSAVRTGRTLTFRWYAVWVAVYAAYALVDEALQALPVVNRTADWRDWLADMAGVVVGFCVAGLISGRRRRAGDTGGPTRW